MTIDKNSLKKIIGSARPKDLTIFDSSKLDQEIQKQIKADLYRMISKSPDCMSL